MNYRLDVLNARALPLALPEQFVNPFVSVYQVALKRTKVGVTNAFPNNPNPTWNASLQVHGIRGLAFCLEIFHFRDNGNHLLIGTAVLNQENIVFGQQIALPVTPVLVQTFLPPGTQPFITVVLNQLPAQPVPSPFQNGPIPYRSIVYLNLAFADPYNPRFPVKQAIGSDSIPLDLTLLLFDANGAVRAIAFNAENHFCDGITHSGKLLTRCYDTYGPSIRFSIDKLFGGAYPARNALVIVNSTQENRFLNQFKWIAVDIYISNEKMNQSDLVPYFHSRVSLPGGCPGTISTVFSLTPSPQGLFVQPIQWFAPNQFVRFTPLFACEVTPELSKLCGYTGMNVVRRTACLPYKPASLTRAMQVCGYPPMIPLTVGLCWNTSADLDAACLVFDARANMRCICFYNNRVDFGGAVQHYGDQRSGKNIGGQRDDETIGFQLAMMPPDAHYLAFTVTSFKGNPLSSIKDIKLSLYVNGTTEIYHLDARHAPINMYGMLFLVIYRSGPTDWAMYPMMSYCFEGVSPVKIEPFVRSEIMRSFH